MILSPQLAVALDITDIERKAKGYWMEPKLDGIRCVASWDGRMFSRSAKTDLGERLPDIRQQVLDLKLPQGVWLDGEVGYLDHMWSGRWPILDFNKTVRVTGSGAGRARYKQMSDEQPIKFWVFDWVEEKNLQTLDQDERADFLWTKFDRYEGSLLAKVPSDPGWLERVYNNYVLDGGEGVILKNPDAMYWPGKRYTQTWFKVKKFDTIDGLIIGFDPGKGKYQGQVGALIISYNGRQVRCSGMTDAQRWDMTNNQVMYRGKMCEVKYFGKVGKDLAGMRHPQFLRMRPDLDEK